MDLTDTLTEPRRTQVDRRGKQERRKVPYAFGSSQWLAHIKAHHLILPTIDRRKQNRRRPEMNARQCLQRLTELQHYASYATDLSPDLFTREEINLIRSILTGHRN
ncbi:hypothetical protein [Methylomonas methanica]|uniref:Uncharacterized protein n=1 Tax=Methylomonas methanica (strain DSM 25384 / MC09) TaxID=857087 RepID=G0A6H9_METMM|nr:hypothetical protein [Methylomonas methanica]AEF99280.1 hypothetical protein Metme_0842 [Methylomonas methanica MC09]